MSFCRRHTLVTGESMVAGNGPRWRELGAGRRVTPLGMPRAFGEGMKIFWNQPGRWMHSLVSGLRAAELTASAGPSGPGRSAQRGRKPALRVCSRHVAATRRSWPAPSAGQRRGARPPLRSVDRERRLFHLFFSPSYGAGTREAQRPQRLLRRAAWLTNALGLRSSGARFLPGAVSVARRWGV